MGDDAETLDTPYTELEKRIAKSILPDNSVDVINSTVSEPPDPYPTGTKVQVYWADEAPAGNDPRLFAYLEMQTETRSLLGLLLWVSLAYPQISHCVNKDQARRITFERCVSCPRWATASHVLRMETGCRRSTTAQFCHWRCGS